LRKVIELVQVILLPTVSRPVRLGVVPLSEMVTRCYIFLSDNYFLSSSCRAPSLTRGRVCNLQCNGASSIPSYIATDGLSASSTWCRAHDQILISLIGNYFLSSRSTTQETSAFACSLVASETLWPPTLMLPSNSCSTVACLQSSYLPINLKKTKLNSVV
jgi:hypothetical protein